MTDIVCQLGSCLHLKGSYQNMGSVTGLNEEPILRVELLGKILSYCEMSNLTSLILEM